MPTIYRASQDELGSKGKFFEMVEKKLKEGNSVVADRCNHTKKHRAALVQIAKKYDATVHLVWIATPDKEAWNRLRDRKEHPTIDYERSESDKAKIYYRFNAEFEYPEMIEEDFDTFEVIGPVNRCPECSRFVIQGPGRSLCATCHNERRTGNA